ncbi:hypothetical protein ACH51_01100 [Ralstonia solanacearum]|nr:hypothetical protein ACH51_01100 [Ralstonia solanacearum]
MNIHTEASIAGKHKPETHVRYKLAGVRGKNTVKPAPSGTCGARLDTIIAEYREQHGKDWPNTLAEWPGYVILSESAGYAPRIGLKGRGGGGAQYWIRKYYPDIFARVQTFRTANGKPRGSQGHDNAAKHQQAYEPFYRDMLAWMSEHELVTGVGLEETPGMTVGWQAAKLVTDTRLQMRPDPAHDLRRIRRAIGFGQVFLHLEMQEQQPPQTGKSSLIAMNAIACIVVEHTLDHPRFQQFHLADNREADNLQIECFKIIPPLIRHQALCTQFLTHTTPFLISDERGGRLCRSARFLWTIVPFARISAVLLKKIPRIVV